MDKAQQKFLEEGLNLINDLEKAVLELENNPADKPSIEEVFRVMHTFKGTAKMFGFDAIGEFTHELENIYDRIRNSQATVSEEILEVTLQSIDHLRSLLLNPEDQNEVVNSNLSALATKLSGIHDQRPQENNKETTNQGLYLIKFKPHKDFLFSGNNPTFLIDDLASLGKHYVKVNLSNLPPIDDFDPEQTYLSWDILLFTNGDEGRIREEFMFVEADCDLEIYFIGENDLLSDKSFCSYLEQLEREVFPEDLLPKQKATGDHKRKPQQTQQTIKVTYNKIDKVMNLISELVTTQARLSLFNETSKNHELNEITENVEKLVRMLRDEAFSISLIPISYLKVRFERLIRDTAKQLGKKVRFVTRGDETELDKKIIENLTDPILHILRNALDHGVESPEERKKSGKEEMAAISMNTYYSGASVIIEISDDGRGLNLQKIRNKALKQNLIAEEDVISEKQLKELIFHPGFSTSETVTDVSGRGVGMDVVTKAIKSLRGEIQIRSREGEGTSFLIRLPLSLSIIDGLLVNVDHDKYVIPLSYIEKCYEVKSVELKHTLNDIIVLENKQVPFINLRELFSTDTKAPERQQLIVVKFNDQVVALAVDGIIDEYQAVLKPLGPSFRDQDFISGGTILGDGSIALVLDPYRLVERIPQLTE